MSDQLPLCPEWSSGYTYESGALLVCPMCAHEWSPASEADADAQSAEAEGIVKDAVGNVLSDGDAVSIVKSLKVKGSGGGALKIGTKVRGIRLFSEPGNDHDIDAKVPSFEAILLKSSVVQKID